VAVREHGQFYGLVKMEVWRGGGRQHRHGGVGKEYLIIQVRNSATTTRTVRIDLAALIHLYIYEPLSQSIISFVGLRVGMYDSTV
jgi:hypothetical protein